MAAEELAYLALDWCVFFAVIYLYRNSGLISIDIIVNNLPKILKKAVTLITTLIIFVASIFLAYYSYRCGMTSIVRTTAFLRISYFWMYLPAIVSFALTGIYSVYFIIRMFRDDEGIDEYPSHGGNSLI
jgi:TRAP-type C4-dicarboxylate transport system permease small subunit